MKDAKLRWYHVVGIFALGVVLGIMSPFFMLMWAFMEAAEQSGVAVETFCYFLG